ncbi:MAG: hypothetical protein F9K23_09595 [Bacteroidetes bacterium]|nr:MAG: hypothetical protein F9K23_09595 [Bacteroidota bacterium]
MATYHSFHIPVMGLSFTIDSPVKVAQYGINSAISIIEDKLVELMRNYYYQQLKEPYAPITPEEPDYRAKRITDYLNIVNRIVQERVEKLRSSTFEKGSEIVKYFEMLPNGNKLRHLCQYILREGSQTKALQNFLRKQVVAGSIDVNIMTKIDRDVCDKQGNVIADTSDALAALRGYAKSDLTDSSIIFSAGMNVRLFNYLENLSEFNATDWGKFNKRIVIKVSDYRSALIQGKYLAKKGLWVSEFRIESGLNCGGHAFASDGLLLGPILEEFKVKREELLAELHGLYKPAVEQKEGLAFNRPHPIDITVQGGIGTAEEADFLIRQYKIGSTGWGTPFLLCPEATTVDNPTLSLLCSADEKDVILSKNSPLGVRFNYLKGTSSEKEKERRIEKGAPGSPCTEKFLVSNTEFTKEPICTASLTYQKHKINQLKSLNLPEAEFKEKYNEVVSKECLCIGLSNSAIAHYGLPPIKNLRAVTICPGPNIAYFDKTVTLRQMTDHIYGRANILAEKERPHMFIKELDLNISYLKENIAGHEKENTKGLKDLIKYRANLLDGIDYYKELAETIFGSDTEKKHRFLKEMDNRKQDLNQILRGFE